MCTVDGLRFSDVQLGDLGGTYPTDSNWARKGTPPVGAPMWSSPEVIMETTWNTATDIWSFGAVISFWVFLANWSTSTPFRPKTVPYGHVEYGLEVLKQQFWYFGPFPGKYNEITGPMTIRAILYPMQETSQSKTTPFYWTMEKENIAVYSLKPISIVYRSNLVLTSIQLLLGHKVFQGSVVSKTQTYLLTTTQLSIQKKLIQWPWD
ncbi:predicted protein [Uncinocarpus reesii 1704]|uniref:Protein kinase domain-containing protein n=1 Tax=Uncinocarpus reesii (strain UAMH 1704) TaxID=336963 RepID=C4JMM0_UNCRE|nr:uncharacterized protein UREG_04078 [Uncinocarpus reesii 1704]EEP79232.1 predicted protein [Uncinocarpus reesii 1704]